MQQEIRRFARERGLKIALDGLPKPPDQSHMSTQQDADVTAKSMAKRSARNIRWLFAIMAAVVIGTIVFTYYVGNRVLVIRNRAVAHRKVIAAVGSVSLGLD